MTHSLPPLYPYKGQSWESYLKSVKLNTNQLLTDNKDNEDDGNVTLLSRKDINVYGICPKMEIFKLIKCNLCNKMLLPTVFKSHNEKFHSGSKIKVPTETITSSTSSPVNKKRESRVKEKEKKRKTSRVPPPPLFPKSSPTPPAIVANSVETVQLTPLAETILAEQKSPQTVVPPPKIPDVKSNQSSNSPKPCIKNNSLVKTSITSLPSSITTTLTTLTLSSPPVPSSPSSCSSMSPSSVSSLPSDSSSNISTGSRSLTNSFVTVSSLTTSVGKQKNSLQKNLIPKESDVDKQSIVTEGTIGPCIRTLPCTYLQPSVKSEVKAKTEISRNNTSTSSAASGTRPSIFQIGTSISVGTSPIPTFTVPLTTQTVLLSMPTPIMRRVGGSLMLRNQRLEKQRDEIKLAISNKCNMISSSTGKTISVLSMHHKPNILKNNQRGSNKIQGIKRITSDKSNSLEHKQSRLTSDVN